MDNTFENRLQAIEYELSQIAESEYLEELKKKFNNELDVDVVLNIIPSRDVSFKTRSLLSAILNRLELTKQDRLDLEKYIVYGGGDNIEYLKQTLAIWVEWKDKILNIIQNAPEEFDSLIEIFNYIEDHIKNSPFEKGEADNSAILKGGNNKATNANEVSLGKYNKSNSDTYFSVGIGTSDIDRKNAFEVKQNGDIYIEGVKGRIQDKLNQSMILVTYAELVELRDNGELVAGMQYRIIDYMTTTTQENTRSASHQFDVIVTADNENTLNEVARTCHSDFDLEKYKDAYSTSWNTKMLYVGLFEYDGKEYHLYEAELQDIQMLVDFNDIEIIFYESEYDYPYALNPTYLRYKEEESWTEWISGKDEGESISFKYTIGCHFYGSNLSAWQIWYCLDNDIERFAWADEINGRGVIYRMIDEWNNDCPYDFKNIQFYRGVYDGGGIAPEGGADMSLCLFTFSFRTEDNEIIDTSIFGNNGRLLNDEGQISGVYSNVIGPYMSYDGSIESPTKTTQSLNDIVFYSHYEYEGGLYYGCYGNSFGNNCYGNSFGNNCYGNSFGNNCYGNSLGNFCYHNSFGTYCVSNNFGNNCWGNSFGNECYLITFNDDCYCNSFSNGCNSVELNESIEYKTASVNSVGTTKVFNLADLADLFNK